MLELCLGHKFVGLETVVCCLRIVVEDSLTRDVVRCVGCRSGGGGGLNSLFLPRGSGRMSPETATPTYQMSRQDPISTFEQGQANTKGGGAKATHSATV